MYAQCVRRAAGDGDLASRIRPWEGLAKALNKGLTPRTFENRAAAKKAR